MNGLIIRRGCTLLYSELSTSAGNNSKAGKALVAEAETEGAILTLLLHCVLFKQSSSVTKRRNEGRDHGNQ